MALKPNGGGIDPIQGMTDKWLSGVTRAWDRNGNLIFSRYPEGFPNVHDTTWLYEGDDPLIKLKVSYLCLPDGDHTP